MDLNITLPFLGSKQIRARAAAQVQVLVDLNINSALVSKTRTEPNIIFTVSELDKDSQSTFIFRFNLFHLKGIVKVLQLIISV